jgi:CarD family transcriptional regulator
MRSGCANFPDKTLKEAMETLKAKLRVKRTMWVPLPRNKRSINSGDLVSIAEVTRDLPGRKTSLSKSYSGTADLKLL